MQANGGFISLQRRYCYEIAVHYFGCNIMHICLRNINVNTLVKKSNISRYGNIGFFLLLVFAVVNLSVVSMYHTKALAIKKDYPRIVQIKIFMRFRSF